MTKHHAVPGFFLFSVLVMLVSTSISAGTTFTYDARKSAPLSVAAPGLLANDLGLGITPLAVKRLNGSSTLTGTSTLGATVTLNADGSFTYNPAPSATLQALAPGQTTTDTFTYTISAAGAVLGGTGMAFTRVPEAANFSLVYQLPIPNMAAYNGGTVPYSVNNSASVTYPFSRIAYYLELDTGTGIQFAYVSMDPFTTDATKIGVPTTQSGAFFQQIVNNLTVVSNAAGVTQGTNLATGNIEFWPSNYNQTNASNIPSASASVYDFGDGGSGTSGGYGSMQVHNHGASQTIFAYNRWGTGNGGSNSDLGIGNAPVADTDWTFRSNANTYTVKNMQVLVLPPQATGTVTINVSNHAVSIASVSMTEGDTGTVTFPFVATLTQASDVPVTVNFATADGSATAPGDYVATTGTVTIPAGQLNATIPISVNGDLAFEPSETFTVTLSNPTNAVLIPAGTSATGTILDNEIPPTITSSLSANAIQGLQFTYKISATGTVPVTYQAAPLPSGLVLVGDTLQGFLQVGSYAITLTATNAGGSDTRTLVINVSTILPNADSDGDGYPDELEVGVGSNPVDPNSTPLTVLKNAAGGFPAGAPNGFPAQTEPFFITKSGVSIRLNFSSQDANRDSITLNGTLPVPPGFSAQLQPLVIMVGGATFSGVLDLKSNYSNTDRSVRMKVANSRPALSGGNMAFNLKAKGVYSPFLADEGLSNADVASTPRIPIFVLVGARYYKVMADVSYKARLNKFGTAKSILTQ